MIMVQVETQKAAHLAQWLSSTVVSKKIDTVGKLETSDPRKRLKVGALRHCMSENDLRRCHERSVPSLASDVDAKSCASEDQLVPQLMLRYRKPVMDSFDCYATPEECLSPTCILDDADLASSSGTNSAAMSMSDSEDFDLETYKVVEEEETVLLNRARQTVDFVDKQKSKMLRDAPRLRMSAWDALLLLKKLKLSSSETVFDQSLAVAELCRKSFPDMKWLHLVGLIHNLGYLTVTKDFGSKPLWTVVGETFPVGCKFSQDISYSQYFSSNPDRRKKIFNHPVGVYKQGCGLDSLRMSWGASEYLCTALEATNEGNKLPREAMFLLRYQKFFSLLNPGQHYHDFMTVEDEECLEMLIEFQTIVDEVCSSRSNNNAQRESVGHKVEVLKYYKDLVQEYFPNQLGFW